MPPAEANRESSGPRSMFHASVPCDLQRVGPAARAGADFLREQGLHAQDVGGCELALVEACNNAILYTPAEERALPIEVQIFCQRRRVELQISDHTAGFDWPATLQLPDADVEHGRGLFIIDSLMDEVFYLRSAGENRLVMRKTLGEGGAHAQPNKQETSDPVEGSVGDLGDVKQKLALSHQVINSMASELCHQIADSRRQRQEWDDRLLAHELEIARNIQQSLLPKIFPKLTGYSLAGFCLSARQVGGDFYDALQLGNNSVLLVVADVMGKGVPAALFAATFRSLLRTTVEWTHDPSEVLARINRLMFEELSAVDMFITAQLALVDVGRNEVRVASAGHCPLTVMHAQGKAEQISPEGMPLGILQDVIFTEERISLEECQYAVMYTDGLTEARNGSGESFGEKRFLDWLRKGAAAAKSAGELAESFLEELATFQPHDALKDDQTLLVLSKEVVLGLNELEEAVPWPGYETARTSVFD